MEPRVLAVFVFAAVGAASFAQPGAPTPRTSWGEPDLTGTWTSQPELSVPFERPAEFGERRLLTDEELAARRAQVDRQLAADNAEFHVETADRSTAGQVGSATSPPPHWLERGLVSQRSSLVVDPPDGRIPAMTPEGRQRAQAGGGTFVNGSFSNAAFNGPKDLSLWERCITRGLPGAMFPTVYNANVRIVQSPGIVAVTYEMIHETRVIATDGRPPPAAAIRAYFGSSQARWEGDTLVVDVTSFSPQALYRGSRETLRLTERFTRIGETLQYEVTIDDPHTWTKPWTAALELVPQAEGMFEYACHEGNHAMRNILSAARAAEKRQSGR